MKTLTQAVLDEMFATQMRPVNLVTFELTGLTLRYAASKTNVTFDGDTYTARYFEYADVLQASNGQIGRVSLRIDNVGATISAFADGYDFAGRTMFIQKVYRDALGAAANFEEVFRGKMEAPRSTNTITEITATAGASLTRRYPHRIYQRLCPHTFGGTDCAREFEGTVSAQGTGGNEKYEFVCDSATVVNLGGFSGTATTGISTKKFTDDNFIGHENDAWNGRQLCWTSGTNEGEFEDVDDFNSTAGRLEFTVGFSFQPVADETFVIGDVFVGYRVQWKTGTNAGEFALISQFVPNHATFGNDAFFAVLVGDAFTADIEVGDTFIVSNADIERAPLLQTGTLSATSTDSITAIDTAGRTEADDFWNYGTLTITNGAVTETRFITDWANGTKTWTVDLPYSFTPTSGDAYTAVGGCDKSWLACSARTGTEMLSNEGFEDTDLRDWAYESGTITEFKDSTTSMGDETKTTGNGYADDEFNGRSLHMVDWEEKNFGASQAITDFDAQAGEGVFTTDAFSNNLGLKHNGSKNIEASYDVVFVAADNGETRGNLTYTVEAAALQTGAVGLNITAGAAQDFELGQSITSGFDERDWFTASASINIDNAASATSITLKVLVHYQSGNDWVTLSSEAFAVGTKGSWQTVSTTATESDGAEVVKAVKFIIEGVQLNGTVFIDDCSLSRSFVPYGATEDNTENYGGFIHIGREGDMPLVGV